MPELPSGANFAIDRSALFDHGGNWTKCPDGHFWYWNAAPEMGLPPFDLDVEVSLMAEHAPVPTSRGDVECFVRVLEMNDDGLYSWCGEWLSSFPQYVELSQKDLAAWYAWINRPETDAFLEETIIECQRLVEVNRGAEGRIAVESHGERDEDGWVKGGHRATKQGH
jgi:hypothetical protein